MTLQDAYCVTIRHNVVVNVEPVSVTTELLANASKLAVSSQLARNHQTHGCIDGEYLFGSLDDAKDFAVLSLDFARLLLEKSVDGLKKHNFYANNSWRNPHVPRPQGSA
jgi:hypothetical protein